MSDFERSGDRAGVTYDEPARRRSPGTFFADLGDRLARGFNSFDRPQPDDGDWEEYEEFDQPTEAVDSIQASDGRRRFQTVLHGYDRDAVDDYIAGLEHEIGQMASKLSAQRSAPPPPPAPSVEDEIARLGQETSAILRVAHEQAAEITRRARVEAERCVADAASNAVAMTDDAKRKLRQLDSETDAVWAERIRLIEDVRNVATSLFSLAEDATDRFPEDADKGGSAGSVIATAAPAKPTESKAPGAMGPKLQPGSMGPATAAGSAHAGPASPPPTPRGPAPHAAPPQVSTPPVSTHPVSAPQASTPPTAPPPVAAQPQPEPQNHRPAAPPDQSPA
jgi:cell division septum initiation protein DivIVA